MSVDTEDLTIGVALYCSCKEHVENAHKIVREISPDVSIIYLHFESQTMDSYPIWISQYRNLSLLNIIYSGSKFALGERGRLCDLDLMKTLDCDFLLSMDARFEYPPGYAQDAVVRLIESGSDVGSFYGMSCKEFLHNGPDVEEILTRRSTNKCFTFPNTAYMVINLNEAASLSDFVYYTLSDMLDLQVGARASQFGISIADLSESGGSDAPVVLSDREKSFLSLLVTSGDI